MAVQHFADAMQNFVNDRVAACGEGDEELETVFEVIWNHPSFYSLSLIILFFNQQTSSSMYSKYSPHYR